MVTGYTPTDRAIQSYDLTDHLTTLLESVPPLVAALLALDIYLAFDPLSPRDPHQTLLSRFLAHSST
jgi:hypothetical protein